MGHVKGGVQGPGENVYRVRFSKNKLGLDARITSWDLKHRIPRERLPL